MVACYAVTRATVTKRVQYSLDITALYLALMGCICYTPMQHMASEVRA